MSSDIVAVVFVALLLGGFAAGLFIGRLARRNKKPQ